MYEHICVYVGIYAYMCLHVHICVYVGIYTYMCLQMSTYECICIYVCACMWVYVCTYVLLTNKRILYMLESTPAFSL